MDESDGTRAQMMRTYLEAFATLTDQGHGHKKAFAALLHVTPRTLSRWLLRAALDDRAAAGNAIADDSSACRQPSPGALALARRVVQDAIG